VVAACERLRKTFPKQLTPINPTAKAIFAHLLYANNACKKKIMNRMCIFEGAIAKIYTCINVLDTYSRHSPISTFDNYK
jgi:hypothetical protein